MTDPKSTDSDANDQKPDPGDTGKTGGKPPARVAAKKPGGERRPWLTWIILFLVVVAVALLAFWNYQQYQQNKKQNESALQSIEYLEKTTERLDRTSSEAGGQLDSRLQSLQAEVRQQKETINEQSRQIEHNARTLLEAGNRTRTDWLLAEAEYLLRVANQRLQIENDIDGALAALRAADDVVRSTDDVGTLPVRKQVAKDILALESIAAVDRTGLYLKLEAAIDAVSNLTDKALADSASGNRGSDSAGGGDGQGDASGQSDSEDTAEGSKVSQMLADGWEKTKRTLNDAINIRRLDEPVKPLLSPKQSVYARLNLRLMLEEAELAVLASNQVLYNRALSKASDWLGQLYDTSHAPVRALIQTLDELNGKDINPDLPDISKSLELLKSRMEGRGGNGGSENNPDSNGESGGDSGDSAATPDNGAKAGSAS